MDTRWEAVGIWFAAAVVAFLLNTFVESAYYSFIRMRKKYIEDNEELDAALAEKAEPYYQHTWDVLIGLKWGAVCCTALFVLALYHMGVHGFFLLRSYLPDISIPIILAGEAAAGIFLLWCYVTITILFAGTKGLVRALSTFIGHLWVVRGARNLFYPLSKSGEATVHALADMKKIPFKNEVDFTYTEDEIRCIVEESHRGGRLNAMENTLIKNSFDFFDLMVKDVMIPRSEIVVLHFDDDLDATRRTVAKTHHTRYPVCVEDKDDIIGFVHIKDILESLLKGSYHMKAMIREILTVPEMMPVSGLLQLMKKKRIYFAVVANEYGGTAGLVTLEDLAEELVGEIPQDADDAPPEIVSCGDGTYEFDGTVILDDVSELLQEDLPAEADSSTIGGFMFSMLERIPKPGDSIVFANWKFTVLKMEGFRVMRVKAERTGYRVGED